MTDLDLLIVRLSASDNGTAADIVLEYGLFEIAFERLVGENYLTDPDLLDNLRLMKDEIIGGMRSWSFPPSPAIWIQKSECIKFIVNELKERAQSIAVKSEPAPVPLGPLGGNGLVKVDVADGGDATISIGDNVLGVVHPDGSTSGTPERGEQSFQDRCIVAVGQEPAYQSMQKDQQNAVAEVIRNSSSAMLVTGGGCGATFVGFAGDGRAMIVTAAHCDWSNDAEVTFRTVWGRPIRAERVYRSNAEIGDPSDERVWRQGGDLAVYLVTAEDTAWLKENATPVQIADKVPAPGDKMIAMAPFWQEAELVVQDRTVGYGPVGPRDPSIGTELRVVNMERVRPGYSGSSLLTLDGRLAGITSNGGYDDIANMGVAGFTSWEQLKRVTEWLGLRYPVTQTAAGVQA